MPPAPLSSAVSLFEEGLPAGVWRGRAPRQQDVGYLSTGLPELDELLQGGLPKGRLSEIAGAPSCGATSLAYRICARATADEAEWLTAWVDAADALDPASASAAGVVLDRFLWVRPRSLRAALAATEQLLVLGGFALVLLDVGAEISRVHRDASPARWVEERAREARHPRSVRAARGRAEIATASGTWLRLARAAASSRSALLVLENKPQDHAERGARVAGPWASVRLEITSSGPLWGRALDTMDTMSATGATQIPPLLQGLSARVAVARSKGTGQWRNVRLALP